MTQEDSRVGDTSESETGSDSGSSDIHGIWAGVMDDGIRRIGRSPSRQYSSVVTSSIKALDKEAQVLEDAIKAIRDRHTNEVRALEGVLKALNEHLKGEEHAILRTITAIRRHRNFLTPMMRLPPEILSRVFMFHAKMGQTLLDGALTSTHVCKRWWKIGQACPGLWSQIDYNYCRSAAWMAEMIKRSRAAPLSLTIDKQAKSRTQKMALVAENMHRFESLHLNVPPENDTSAFLNAFGLGHPSEEIGSGAFFKTFSKSAPLLQCLTLLNHGHSTFAFPPAFLGGSTPNLRHIKLNTRCCIPWDSGIFAHLVTLNVSGPENFGSVTPPCLRMLLRSLARMPELEILILRHCLPPSALSATVGAHVDLSRLKRLEVATSLTCCTCFLGQITINAGAIVLLDLEQCSRASKEDAENFFTVFTSHLYTTSAPIAQALKFTCNYPYDFQVDVWSVQQNAEFKNSENASIKLDFDWSSTRSHRVNALNLAWACFAAFASHELRSFRISGGHIVGWDAEVWRRLARAAPDLRRLAGGAAAQSAELCEALSPPDGPDSVLADCCLPALTYLELEPPAPTPDGEEPLLSVAFARSLAMRASIGCSTPELVFIKKGDYDKDWFEPFDAVPGLVVRMGQRRADPEM